MRGGVTTSLTYDYAGRKTGMTDPDMGVWAYTYDALGNLKSQTDARGCITNLSYDTLNRLIQKSYNIPTGCGASSTATVNYTYDDQTNGNLGVGRRTGMTDGSGSTGWKYDARGRMIQEEQDDL